jgi:hypothetical protein
MTRKHLERSLDELYADDAERAEAQLFGRRVGPDRRGFLGGAGLVSMGRRWVAPSRSRRRCRVA